MWRDTFIPRRAESLNGLSRPESRAGPTSSKPQADRLELVVVQATFSQPGSALPFAYHPGAPAELHECAEYGPSCHADEQDTAGFEHANHLAERNLRSNVQSGYGIARTSDCRSWATIPARRNSASAAESIAPDVSMPW